MPVLADTKPDVMVWPFRNSPKFCAVTVHVTSLVALDSVPSVDVYSIGNST